MGSHSGKREKRKAREAERYWRLKKDYDERITKLEERRRQIMEQLEPGSGETESLIRQPSLSSLRDNCIRVREALEEVLQCCDSRMVTQHSQLKAVGESSSDDLPGNSPPADKKTKVLVFKSDGTPKGQQKAKGVAGHLETEEYQPEIGGLRGSIEVALQTIEELLSVLEGRPMKQQVLPPEEPGNLEDGEMDGMLDILKSPMVAELVSSLLTSIKK